MENIVKQYAYNKFGSEDVFEEFETNLVFQILKIYW